jgi:hypothetical protein
MQEDVIPVELNFITASTSTSGSLLNTVIAPSLGLFDGYGSYISLYNEWRMLSCEARYVPNTENAVVASIVYTPCASVIDRASSSALSTLTAAMDYASAHLFPLNKRDLQVFKMSGSEDADFISITTGPSCYFKYLAGPTSASTIYGYFHLRAIWQFRGRI